MGKWCKWFLKALAFLVFTLIGGITIQIVSPAPLPVNFRGPTCVNATAQTPGQPQVPSDREFDIVIHGATGFTGELTAQYLGSQPRDISYAIAGRSKEKLDTLAAKIQGRKPAGILLADSGDLEQLTAMARRTKVVLAAAGPYATYGTLLAQACAETGTHYADLSGEVFWQRRMLNSPSEEAAARTGAKLVFAAGFDSVPFDLGAQLALKALDAAAGGKTTDGGGANILATVLSAHGGASGGTIAAVKASLAEIREEKVASGWDSNPYLLVPNASCRVDLDVSGFGGYPRYHPTIGTVAVGHFMAPINARIVRRSLALLGRPEVSYTEAMTLWSLMDAVRWAVPYIVTREMKLLPEQGQGPPPSVQMHGSYDASIIATTAGPGQYRAELHMRGSGDPGYSHTSKLFAEVGLCLIDVKCHRAVGGGIYSPLAALDRDMLEQRLREAKHDDGQPLLTYTVVKGKASSQEL